MPGLLRSLYLFRSVKRCALPIRQHRSRTTSAGYYVLLPEVPDDTPDTNSFLRLGDIPQYKGITGEMAYNGLAKRIFEYEDSIQELEEKLQDPDYPKTFETTIGEVDKLQVPLLKAWHNFKHLTLIQNEAEFTDGFKRLHGKFRAAIKKHFQSQVLYSIVKDFQKEIDKFEPDQQQLIRKYQLECKLSGLDLNRDEAQALREHQASIQKNSYIYNSKLNDATNAFKHRIDGAIMKNFPEYLLHHFATSSGFIVTLNEPQFSIFLSYCGDRQERWNLYQAKAIRCSMNNKSRYNIDEVEAIRVSRHFMAKLFGFNNYAEYSLETKMAPSFGAVQKTLFDLSKSIAPVADRQMTELRDFCAQKGFKVPLERWDLPYWRRRYRDANLAIEEGDLKQLFALPAVIEGMVRLVDALFGVELRQVKPKESLWAEDITVFNVAVEGKEVGKIFLDLQARSEKKLGNYCTVIRAANAAAGVQPSTSVVMSLNNQTHVSLSELSQFLRKMGHALQHTLSRARYSETAGLANLPHDVSEVCPTFFDMLLLDKRFARMLSANEALPDDYHKRIVEQKLHLYAVDMQIELFKSLADLEFYSTKDFSEDITKKVYTSIVKSFPWQFHETFLFGGFWEVIIGGYQAGYYTHVWGPMLAAEIFQAMRECPEEDSLKVSRRFCNSILLDGGCESPSEAFRKFRGRDPTPDSLLAVCNLK
ncbi:organellar oligopeptidase A, chloroplastic/mitochondrial [Galendromus occidentalis]|uniref:Organellar oligopeptidase A, chloroplastic/mitochondrial n=1 Tax=Galendromus occidentalis TaxID=34638 RepID=A0AAJ6VY45_9ACAR|nr:organellar oligopeptidase A, chloroplastic/mitochondrial [Galendromus occidentalis]